MKKENINKKRINVSTKAFTIPLLIIVTLIHISIIMLIININRASNNLFDLMQRSGDYQIDATSMQASNTVMSETCNNYIQMPVTADSSPDVGPLMAYVNELSSERRSPKVAERFRHYNVSSEVLICVVKASEYSEQIKDIQIHAISVMASVYPLPPIPELATIASDPLTAAEIAMTNEERVAHAKQLIVDTNYAQLRYRVAENIENCNKILQQEFSQESAKTKDYVTLLRNVLWVEIFAIIFILAAAFVMFYLLIVKPLQRYSKNIADNKSIKYDGSISEMNQLVDAFNGLWDYRNKQESLLRTEAENDALTGLPNRYCLERDIIKQDTCDSSVAVVMFDVNFLKRTNDTEGHLAGDNLIRTTAACIKECFATENGNNCYRIGGDEFVALLCGDNEEEIQLRIDKFKLALIREHISVSVGYSYAEKADKNNIKSLFEEADKNMYEQKKQIHNIEE